MQIDFKDFFYNLNQGIVYYDRDGNIVEANPAAQRIIGLSTEKMRDVRRGKEKLSIIQEDGSPYSFETFPSMVTLKTGKPLKDVLMGIWMPQAGEYEWITIDTHLHYNEEGNINGVFLVYHDISELKKLQLQLEREKERFALAVEGTNDGLWDWDPVSNTTFFSHRYKQMLGYRDDEMKETFDAWHALIHEEDRPKVEKALEDHFKGREPFYEVEHRLRTKSGAYKWILARGKALFNQTGEPVRMVGFHTDIDEKKHLEKKYKEEHEFNRTIIDSAGSIVVVLDTHGTIVRINKSIKTITGFAADEVVGNSVFDIFIPAEIKKDVKEVFMSIHIGNFPDKYENEWMTKSGERIPIAWGNSFILDDNGKIKYVIAVGVDITEIKALREKLQKAEQNFNRAQEVAHIGSWYWNIKENTLAWSDEIYRIFGLHPQEFEATYDAFLKYIHPEDRKAVENGVNNALNNNIPYAVKHRVVRPDGEIRIVNEIGKLTWDDTGAPTSMLGTVQDITELEKTQKELEEYKNYLEEKVAQEVRIRKEKEMLLQRQSRMAEMGEMISAIAHQLKQPINAIGLAIQDIDDAFEYGEINREYITYFIESTMDKVQFMADTIDDFRNFFKSDKQKKVFSIREMITSVERIFSAQLKRHAIEYSVDIPDTLHAYGFQNEFKQVILNLLNNAKDAIIEQPQHKGIVSQIAITGCAEGKNAVIQIQDTGGGIPKEAQEHIFEPYFSTKDEKTGTGIGLHIAKTIIEKNMNGRLEVENIGNGACFSITLPME